jgi:hypothetical protein
MHIIELKETDYLEFLGLGVELGGECQLPRLDLLHDLLPLLVATKLLLHHNSKSYAKKMGQCVFASLSLYLRRVTANSPYGS